MPYGLTFTVADNAIIPPISPQTGARLAGSSFVQSSALAGRRGSMEPLGTTLFTLLVVWAVITAALICMLIYRGTLETHEEDQIFLDKAGDSMAQEQRLIVARIERLGLPIKLLITASVLLLLIIAGLWLWQGFKNF